MTDAKPFRRRCPSCAKRTEHTQTNGPLVGRGTDAYRVEKLRCLECGNVETQTCYPNLLADIFSLPARKKEDNDEAR